MSLKQSARPSHLIQILQNHQDITSKFLLFFFPRVTQKCIRCLIKYYCNNLDIILIYTSFKIVALLSVKNPVPSGLHSWVIYKFSCAGCEACYVGETCRHFTTHVQEHLTTDRASHVFKHLESSSQCRSLCLIDS